jgi:hypothetical protein
MPPTPRYLFLQRDSGTAVFTVTGEPTPADLESVRFSLLDIVRLEDLAQLSRAGEWHPISAGALASREVLGPDDPPFHVAPSGQSVPYAKISSNA